MSTKKPATKKPAAKKPAASKPATKPAVSPGLGIKDKFQHPKAAK